MYIGPASQDEAIAALVAHGDTPGATFILYLHDAARRLVWQKTADLTLHIEGVEEEEPSVTLGFSSQPHSSGNPLILVDPELVLTFARGHAALEKLVQVDQYSGGVRLHLAFGTFPGHTLTFVFWSGIQHVTPTGDIAPGIGPFQVKSEEEG